MDEPLWTKDMSGFRDPNKAIGSEVELADGKSEGFIAGWASTPDLDAYRHVVANGAFAESIAKAGISGPKGIKLLIGHDWDKPAGRITKLEYRPKGLWIEANLNLEIQYARDIYHAAKSNGGLSFSVGFRPSREPGDMEVLTDANDNEYLLIRKGQLREVSVVANPANEGAVMEMMKSLTGEAEEELTKANTPNWRVGAARNLPLNTDTTWDGAAARGRIFDAAGIGGDDPDLSMVRRAFLVYDSANPTLRGSYKLPFADISGGRLRASPAGLRAAASRLPQTDIPEAVMARARDVIDGYQDRMENAQKNLTLPQLQDMLVEEGWVKGEEEAEGLMMIIKANLHLFKEERQSAEMTLSAEDEARAREAITRLKSLLETKEAH